MDDATLRDNVEKAIDRDPQIVGQDVKADVLTDVVEVGGRSTTNAFKAASYKWYKG